MSDTDISTVIPYRRCKCSKSKDNIIINELEVISAEDDSESQIPLCLVCVDIVDQLNKVGSAELLGLLSMGFNGIVIGLCLILQIPMNIAVSLTLFHSRIIHFLCGVWEMYRGYTMNTTSFTSIGAFWIQLGTINIPPFGTGAACGDNDEMFYNAMGLIFLAFGFFELMMTSLSLRGSVTGMLNPLTFAIAMFFSMLQDISQGIINDTLLWSGYSVLLMATIGFYDAFAQISTKHHSYFQFANITIPNSASYVTSIEGIKGPSLQYRIEYIE